MVSITQGTHPLTKLAIQVGSNTIANVSINGSGNFSTTTSINGKTTITATVEDDALYTGSGSRDYTPPRQSNEDQAPNDPSDEGE